VDDNGRPGAVPLNAVKNYLVDPLPENILLFTVQYVDEDCITLRNAEGKYLTCDKLSWVNTPEENVTVWRLKVFNGGWQLISTEESATGRRKAMQLYKALLSTYDLGPNTGFCFNFYEPKNSSSR
jgi:hypothetical protein